MVPDALKTEQTRQVARIFAHVARDNSCCWPGAPAHLLPSAPRAAGWRSGLFASYATSRVLPADTPLRAIILTIHKTLGLCEAQRGTWVLTTSTCSLRTSKRRGYHRPSARRIGGCRGTSITKPAERTGRPSTHRRDELAEICSDFALPRQRT